MVQSENPIESIANELDLSDLDLSDRVQEKMKQKVKDLLHKA